jgi:aminopeptidase
VAGSVLSAEQLARYADAVVVGCLRMAPGDVLFVQGQPAHRELAVALAEAAFRAGAADASIDYADSRVSAARIKHASDEHLGRMPPWRQKLLREQLEPAAANVTIIGEGDPGAFDGLPPARLAEAPHRRAAKVPGYLKAVRAGRYRWTGCGWPTPHWAGQVYPELDEDAAMGKLAADLLWFCRLGPDDPPGTQGWETHADALAQRAETLTGLGLRRLELRGDGTHLELAVPETARWVGGREDDAHGRRVSPNFPTEENFTSPVPGSTRGKFRCSRPLSFRGRLIDGIAGEFRGGRLKRLDAATESDRDLLAAFLDSDRGASRLGEIALVDRSSRIGQAQRHYANTLIDENAAAHMAFGSGFDIARVDGGRRHAVNKSSLHLDVMIGTDDLEVTGFTEDGRAVPLIRGGDWQI